MGLLQQLSGKGICYRVQQGEFHPPNPQGRRKEQIPLCYPLTYTPTPPHPPTHPPTHMFERRIWIQVLVYVQV